MRKNREDYLKAEKSEIPMNTPLNPEFGMSADFNAYNPLQSESFYTGESVDEHVVQEEANEYLADKDNSEMHPNFPRYS